MLFIHMLNVHLIFLHKLVKETISYNSNLGNDNF